MCRSFPSRSRPCAAVLGAHAPAFFHASKAQDQFDLFEGFIGTEDTLARSIFGMSTRR
jgi:hypothetical protein